MTSLIYDLLVYLYFIVSLPFYLYKLAASEKYRCGLKQRLGFVPSKAPPPCLLIHAVSVGEFLAAWPLVDRLTKDFSNYEIVLSTTTLSGNRIARKKLGEQKKIVYFPLDFRWAVNTFLTRIQPQLVILLETELWPNFLQIVRKKGIPVVVINGRVSERSFKRYLRWRNFFIFFCQGIKKWGMQFPLDRERITELGISEDKVVVTGSLKFDSALARLPHPEEMAKIRQEWGWPAPCPVLVAGSTHRGEEKILLDIYQQLQDNLKQVVLIIAPRHPERTKEIELLIKRYGFPYRLRSAWNRDSRLIPGQIALVDTLGELINIYSLASLVFIGKSMVAGGGQNLLEPAALGKAVVCGPYMDNFSTVTRWLVENDAIVQVANTRGLREAVTSLLENPERCSQLGNRAQKLIISAAGTLERNIALIRSMI